MLKVAATSFSEPQINICCSLNCIHVSLIPIDHFVHMVLFFHCADDDDKPVLRARESAEA